MHARRAVSPARPQSRKDSPPAATPLLPVLAFGSIAHLCRSRLAATIGVVALFRTYHAAPSAFFEDGVEQDVNTFSAGDAPVSVGLILDSSGSMETKLPMARLALAQFLKTANPEDEFFLSPFNTLPRPASVLTKDVGGILEEVVRAEANGRTALLDALFVGLHEKSNPTFCRVYKKEPRPPTDLISSLASPSRSGRRKI